MNSGNHTMTDPPTTNISVYIWWINIITAGMLHSKFMIIVLLFFIIEIFYYNSIQQLLLLESKDI